MHAKLFKIKGKSLPLPFSYLLCCKYAYVPLSIKYVGK